MSNKQSEKELETEFMETLSKSNLEALKKVRIQDTDSEAITENKMIQALKILNYEFVTIHDVEALEKNFHNTISKHNLTKHLNNKPLSKSEFERLLIKLEGKGVFDSSKSLRELQVIKRDDGSDVYIELIDKNYWCNNIFQVTNQITVKTRRVSRYDVTILINGLPLVQIELKKRGLAIEKAFHQINRYKATSFPGLFKYLQLFIISNGVNSKYLSNDDLKLNYNFAFFWTNSKNERISNLNDFIKSFLSPCQLSKIISRYMVLNQTDKKLMVMRPYQIFATEKIVDRAINTRNNGYVWHATGSGKTLTSFKTAQILSLQREIDKVIFLVDRKDLDAQTLSEFNKFENNSVDLTNSTKKLVEQLNDSNNNLIITTIQKMNNAIKNKRYVASMSKYEDKRVIFIIDECHRSQFGNMHKEIKLHFKKAQYFGFTGTPIFAEQSGGGLATGNLFGKLIHSYMIKNAINDNNVLGFKVDYLKTFSTKENIVDQDVEDINSREILESNQRVDVITEKILNIHDLKTHNKEFNALFAVSSIAMAIKFYKAFKSKQHNYSISAIFTYDPNEDLENKENLSRDELEEIIKDYNKKFTTNFSTDTYSNYFTDLSKRFKNNEIDILIVVDMFLTGFDSKNLNTLYLDKSLKLHNLIQAFSRTNRLSNLKKQFGNIVSFATKKKDVEDAVKLYSDSNNIDEILLEPYKEYINRAKRQVQLLKTIVPTVQHVDTLMGDSMKKDFIEAYKALIKTITTLSYFLEFDFSESVCGISEQEYLDYKSKYLDLHKSSLKSEKASIIDDIDFQIEFLSQDTINVDYIINLLKSIDHSNVNQKNKEVEKIKKILDQNDTESLHSKIELLRKFISEVVPTLKNEDNIEARFETFAEDVKNQAIDKKCKEIGIDVSIIKEMISEYQFTNVIPNDMIRKYVKGKFLEKSQKMNVLKDFIYEISEIR